MDSCDNDCKSIVPSLDAYHDGELDADEKASVEKHLAGCEQCTAALSAVDRVASALKQAPRAEMSADFADRLDKALDKATRPNGLPPRVWLPVGIAAAAVIVGLAVSSKAFLPGDQVVAQKSPSEEAPQIIRDSNDSVAEQRVAKNSGEKSPQSIVQNNLSTQNTASPAVQPLQQPPLVELEGHSKAVNRHGIAADTTVMEAPAQIKEEVVVTDSSELADISGAESLPEAIGLATDEDGLYDLQL